MLFPMYGIMLVVLPLTTDGAIFGVNVRAMCELSPGEDICIYHDHNLSCVLTNVDQTLPKASNGSGSQTLIQREDVPTKAIKCRTDLHRACWKGHMDRVRTIVLQGRDDVDCRNQGLRTPIMTAALSGQKSVVDLLIDLQADLSLKYVDKTSVLHFACLGGNVNIVRRLVETGLDVDSRGCKNLTPVHISASSGNIQLFDYLVEKECNIQAVSRSNSNALHFACLYGKTAMVAHILKYRFSLGLSEQRKRGGLTPLLLAVQKNRRRIVHFLVNYGCRMNTKTDNGDTVLHLAAKHASLALLEYIVSLNVSEANCLNEVGETPIMVARRMRRKKSIIRLL